MNREVITTTVKNGKRVSEPFRPKVALKRKVGCKTDLGAKKEALIDKGEWTWETISTIAIRGTEK